MSLTTAQYQALKAAIAADSTANAFAHNDDGNKACADYMNTVPGSPLSVWRNDVKSSEIVASIVMSEYVALTAVKQQGLFLILAPQTVDATSSNVRSAFSSIFAAGTTLTALTAVAQRSATRFEAIAAFVTAAAPANLSSVYGYRLSGQDVAIALNS